MAIRSVYGRFISSARNIYSLAVHIYTVHINICTLCPSRWSCLQLH